MKKYEIWGVDDAGKHGLLAYANLDAPALADTVVVRGQTREITKIWRHHTAPAAILRLEVAEASEGTEA